MYYKSLTKYMEGFKKKYKVYSKMMNRTIVLKKIKINNNNLKM